MLTNKEIKSETDNVICLQQADGENAMRTQVS